METSFVFYHLATSKFPTLTLVDKIPNLFKTSNIVPPACYSDTVLSISNTSEINSISIYPNPNSDILKINARSPIVKVEIFNLDGKKMANYENLQLTNNFEINTVAFPAGYYKVVVNTSKGSFSKSVIFRR